MNTTTARAILISGLLLAMSVHAGWTMRCTNGIVDTGDTVQQVITACGQPNFKQGDIWGDQSTLTYILADGSVWTVQTLNGVVTDVGFSR